MLCSKCRRSMEQKVADRTGGSRQAATSRVLPQIARLRQYQRLAAEQGVPFAIAEGAAADGVRLLLLVFRIQHATSRLRRRLSLAGRPSEPLGRTGAKTKIAPEPAFG